MDALIALRQLESAVAERRHGDAQQYLLWLLANASVHRARQDSVFLPNYSDSEITYVATRIASAACQLFADPQFGIDDDTFFLFAKCHGHLATILGISGFNTGDHVIQNLLEPVQGSKAESISRKAFNKILILHGIHSEVKLPYEHYLQSHPRHLLWLVLAAVSAQFCVLEKENAARNQLLANLAQRLDITAFDESMLGWLCVAWMHCSYATVHGRNTIKQTLNRMLVHWMAQLGFPQQQQVEPEMRQGKPVLLIVNEQFHSGHAMYRCLAPMIDALRERFYLVGMTEKDKSDSTARKHFDSHYYLEWQGGNQAALKTVLAQMAKIRPHAIYYPSVGMSLPVILLANLRIAPCQLMSLGHPASSHSAVMDYCLVEQQYLVDESLYSETVLCAVNGALGFVPHAEQPARAELLQMRKAMAMGDPVRIAIPASAMKVNAEFIDALGAIRRRVSRPVEFHFFPYLNPLASVLFRKQVNACLPGSVVHAPMPYQTYLRTIARCQLHLSPFPFSSTNSLLDSLLLGIPLVVKRVATTEAGVDAAIVDQVGIPALQPQASVQDYVDFACRLIDDDAAREQLSDAVRNTDIERIFYGSHQVPAAQTAAFVHETVVRHVAGEKPATKILQVSESL